MSKGDNRRPRDIPKEVYNKRWDRAFNRDKLYGRRWRKASKQFLTEHPLCVYCERDGRTTVATVCDHIVPHKGDPVLFWDWENNWQQLCKFCHDSIKKSEEMSGRIRGCDVNGQPLDKSHYWNQ